MGVRRSAGAGGGSGSSATDPWVFKVTDYGAVGDGSTDDTTAFLEAQDAAVTYALANTNRYYEMWMPVRPDPYSIESALVQGGTTKGNSQIPIPVVDPEDRKLTAVYRGCVDAAAMPYWEQTVGQRWGVTLLSTLTGQTESGSWGAPSILGGPSATGSLAEFGPSHSSTFNNVAVVLDGVGFATPVNPTVGGINLIGCAQAAVRRCAVIANAATATIQATPPAHDWTFGVMMPENTNNDRLVLEDFSVYGHYVGIRGGEHMWCNRSASIYCHDGLVIPAQLENIHSSAFGAISIEGCVDGIRCYATDSYGAPIHMAAVSMETITGYHVNDPNNALDGVVHLTKLDGPSGIAVNGARNLRILAANADLGAVTAPSVPATTVALKNPFWRDADVLVSGGTVTQIAIDGVSTGLTSGWIPVPSGASITLTHSSAPTWKWWVR